MIQTTTLLLLFTLCLLGVTTISTEAANPLLVEYIDEYRVKVNDLKDVINKQFASITIGKVNTSYAEIKGSSFSLSYKGTGQSQL